MRTLRWAPIPKNCSLFLLSCRTWIARTDHHDKGGAMKVIIRALVLLAGITSLSSAHATLIKSDLGAIGDGLLTVDTATGLEWLDVTATLGLSFNQAIASDFATSQGFKHATASEILSLFDAAALTNSPARLAGNYAGGVLLVGLMGPGIDFGNVIEIEGWYDAGAGYTSTAVIDYAKTNTNGIASLNFRVMARYYEYERAKKPDWRGFWSTGSERESVYTNWPKTDPD